MIQHGSRHRYAIPRMLEARQLLARFYTDTSSHSCLGRIGNFLGDFTPKPLRRLLRRQIKGVSKSKIRSTDYCSVSECITRLQGKALPEGIDLFVKRHQMLSQKMQKWGVGDAKTVYSMYHENLDFLKYAKSKGLRLAVDVFINPRTDQIMIEEESAFALPANLYNQVAVDKQLELWIETAELADLLLCPSEWVADGVQELSPQHAHKIRLVPYGCSMDYQGKTNQPQKGKILFAGQDVVRKGLEHLAIAATKLREQGSSAIIQVAGELPEEIIKHSLCKDLDFIGRLNASEMRLAFLQSDAFVLPSLSEGFAGVVAESIMAGCPVIVTRECGSPVVHEREGLIVPARDPDALASAISRLVEDRELRASCSRSCLKETPFYSESSWGDRLQAALIS